MHMKSLKDPRREKAERAPQSGRSKGPATNLRLTPPADAGAAHTPVAVGTFIQMASQSSQMCDAAVTPKVKFTGLTQTLGQL